MSLRALQPIRFRMGEYEAIARLAHGGMGTVYLARRTGAAGFERLVVLKCIHPHLLEDPSVHRMVITEAKLASAIHHANVVPVVDVSEWSGSLSLVLDYVESVNLSELRRAVTTMPAPIISRIVCDLLSGLEAAHGARDIRGEPLTILHRDVSPQNVVIGTDGVSRLIDFGISKAAGAETTKDVLRGKLRYMAPEQIRKKPLDPRVDIFAAGVVLVELLQGKPPFSGASDEEVALLVLLEETQDMSDLPFALRAVAEEATARDVLLRYRDAATFRRALEAACPPATHAEVAAIVHETFGDAFEDRRRNIAELLDGGALPRIASAADTDPGPMTGSATRPSNARPLVAPVGAPARPLAKWPLLVLGASLVVGVAAAAGIVALRSARSELPDAPLAVESSLAIGPTTSARESSAIPAVPSEMPASAPSGTVLETPAPSTLPPKPTKAPKPPRPRAAASTPGLQLQPSPYGTH